MECALVGAHWCTEQGCASFTNKYNRSMHKAFMYRLYPTTKQAEQLTWILDRCRELYNAALEERREAYRMAGKSLSYNKQAGELPGVKDVRPEYKQVGSQVLQDVLKRVDHAFQAGESWTGAGLSTLQESRPLR